MRPEPPRRARFRCRPTWAKSNNPAHSFAGWRNDSRIEYEREEPAGSSPLFRVAPQQVRGGRRACRVEKSPDRPWGNGELARLTPISSSPRGGRSASGWRENQGDMDLNPGLPLRFKAKLSVQAHLSRAESVSAKRIRLRADLRGRAYPAAKGRAGGKLPSGNVTVRSPFRSFSAASR